MLILLSSTNIWIVCNIACRDFQQNTWVVRMDPMSILSSDPFPCLLGGCYRDCTPPHEVQGMVISAIFHTSHFTQNTSNFFNGTLLDYSTQKIISSVRLDAWSHVFLLDFGLMLGIKELTRNLTFSNALFLGRWPWSESFPCPQGWRMTESDSEVWFQHHLQMGVSKNRGTPKWMVYNGKPY